MRFFLLSMIFFLIMPLVFAQSFRELTKSEKEFLSAVKGGNAEIATKIFNTEKFPEDFVMFVCDQLGITIYIQKQCCNNNNDAMSMRYLDKYANEQIRIAKILDKYNPILRKYTPRKIEPTTMESYQSMYSHLLNCEGRYNSYIQKFIISNFKDQDKDKIKDNLEGIFKTK